MAAGIFSGMADAGSQVAPTVNAGPSERLTFVQFLVASWGVFGVLLLVGRALWRLTPIAIEPVTEGLLGGWLWVLYIGWALFNGYAEGYRGFQLRFSPRVVARAFYLSKNPTWSRVLLGPLFCMALFHANNRKLITAWVLVGTIVVLVMSIRLLPQPWRGIVDVGVVVGLGWGATSLLVIFFLALLRGKAPPDDSLPKSSEAQARTNGADKP